MTEWPIVRLFLLFAVVSATGFEETASRCPSDSECGSANRGSCLDPVQGYCGPCLSGYEEDVSGVCIKAAASAQAQQLAAAAAAAGHRVAQAHGREPAPSCVEASTCAASNRLPCTSDTRGQCGSCLPEHIDVEGVCITESDAVAVLQFIETDLASRRNKPLTQSSSIEQSYAGTRSGTEAAVQMAAGNMPNKWPGVPADGAAVRGDIIESHYQNDIASTNSPVSGSVTTVEDMVHEDGTAVAHMYDEGRPIAHDISQLASIVVILGATLLAVAAIAAASVYWFRLLKKRKNDATDETKHFSSSPSSASLDEHWHRSSPKAAAPSTVAASSLCPLPGGGFDKKLAQSALMYHFEHSKQQIVTRQKALASHDAVGNSDSDADDEADASKTEQGEYTVYECPGLAPTSEMEVHNPLFDNMAARKSPSLDSNSNSSITSPVEDRRK